jgi:hypothetical protein
MPENQDFCRLCTDGGDLICCDSCIGSYHGVCLDLDTDLLPDPWKCPQCILPREDAAIVHGEESCLSFAYEKGAACVLEKDSDGMPRPHASVKTRAHYKLERHSKAVPLDSFPSCQWTKALKHLLHPPSAILGPSTIDGLTRILFAKIGCHYLNLSNGHFRQRRNCGLGVTPGSTQCSGRFMSRTTTSSFFRIRGVLLCPSAAV